MSVPISALGASVEKEKIYESLYKTLTESIPEDKVKGVQIVPSKWPRKILITLNDTEFKEKLMIEGLTIFNKHVDVQDENGSVRKIIVKDAPVEWSDDDLRNILQNYGNIVRIENERIYVNGAQTTWVTGTRYVFFSPLESHITHKLDVTYGTEKVSLVIWYRGQPIPGAPPGSRCSRCGSDQHAVRNCKKDTKVCFICQGNHMQQECPKNDGTKSNKDTLVFLSGKSTFSNFNMEYPVDIDGETFICNEQYIQGSKCRIFNDKDQFEKIMESEDPKEMKYLGDRVDNYDHDIWMQKCERVALRCNREKYAQHEKARKELLSTEEKMIGEGSANKVWGVGMHISDTNVIDQEKWKGFNLMGNILMQIRSEIREDNQDENHEETADSVLDVTSDQECEKELDEYIVFFGDSNMRDVDLNDDTINVKVEAVVGGGTMLRHTENRISKVNVPEKQVRVAGLHLGTCNFDATGKSCSTRVYTEYVEALNTLSSKYSDAEIVISSVPLRGYSPKGEEINVEIKALNRRLKDLSIKEENVFFVDNDEILVKDGKVRDDVYIPADITGVHLNDRGKQLLAEHLRNGIREAYSKNKLRVEWKVAARSRPFTP